MLINQWIRVIRGDNGTLTDASLNAQIDGTISLASLVASEDYLYIGQHFPFNNIFFQIDTANDQASVMSVELWDGIEWNAVANQLDGTDASGVTLARDGVLQFVPDRDETWDLVTYTDEEPAAFGLETLKLYDLYWARLKWSADLGASTAIKRLGYAFCTDSQLVAIDSDINNYRATWSSGKTDWIDQIMLASEMVVIDLKGKGLIMHPGQILRLEDVSLATAYKTLELIYAGLDEGFEGQRDYAAKMYQKLIGLQRWTFDQNKDGRAAPNEIHNVPVRGVR